MLVTCDAVCANVVNYCGQSISWVTEIRYLGIYEGLSISFEPGYLGLYFWAEKCCRPDLLTLISVL